MNIILNLSKSLHISVFPNRRVKLNLPDQIFMSVEGLNIQMDNDQITYKNRIPTHSLCTKQYRKPNHSLCSKSSQNSQGFVSDIQLPCYLPALLTWDPPEKAK